VTAPFFAACDQSRQLSPRAIELSVPLVPIDPGRPLKVATMASTLSDHSLHRAALPGSGPVLLLARIDLPSRSGNQLCSCATPAVSVSLH